MPRKSLRDKIGDYDFTDIEKSRREAGRERLLSKWEGERADAPTQSTTETVLDRVVRLADRSTARLLDIVEHNPESLSAEQLLQISGQSIDKMMIMQNGLPNDGFSLNLNVTSQEMQVAFNEMDAIDGEIMEDAPRPKRLIDRHLDIESRIVREDEEE